MQLTPCCNTSPKAPARRWRTRIRSPKRPSSSAKTGRRGAPAPIGPPCSPPSSDSDNPAPHGSSKWPGSGVRPGTWTELPGSCATSCYETALYRTTPTSTGCTGFEATTQKVIAMSTVDEATARPSARKPLIGAQVGLYVDMFDVYLPIIVLAPAAIYFEPDHLSATGSRILTAVVFAATLLGRPLGAL